MDYNYKTFANKTKKGPWKQMIYSDLDTVSEIAITSELESDDNSCTYFCESGRGDYYKPSNHKNPSDINIDYEDKIAFPKHVADRYEAQYDYCMRWAADRRYHAIQVIPFESNFYSVVRLLFVGKNWILDCANFVGQYDYCGWLPSDIVVPETIRKNNDYSIESYNKQMAEFSKTPMEIETVRCTEQTMSIIPEKRNNDYLNNGYEELTFDPIDENLYDIMGPSRQISVSHDLDDVFQDLIQLNNILSEQAASIRSEVPSDLITAQSFSNSSKSSNGTVFEDTEYSDTTNSNKETSRSLVSQLFCLNGKRFATADVFNWIKAKI